MTGNDTPAGTTEGAHPEDPNRFPDDEVAPLDEAPDGHTPGEATGSGADSLPPGAGQKPE
jgi:hypothetical protein